MKATRLVIELEHGSEPLAGRIQRADGEPERFAGYLELIAAFEAMRREPDQAIEPVDQEEEGA